MSPATSLIATFFRLRRAWLWLLLLTLLALGLAFTPLFNLLGYEFCLALALAGSFAAAHLGAVLVAAARREDWGLMLALPSPPAALTALLLRVVGANLLLLALPLAIISLNALRVRNCNFLEGLAFFALLPVLSVTVAATVGALAGLALPRPLPASVAALLAVLGSLGWGLYRFYAAPPIFGYDPFVGYFAGTLYDEDITIRLPLLLYRGYNLLWLLAAVLLAGWLFDPAATRLRWPPRRPGVGLALATLLAVGAALGTTALRHQLGFSQDAASIQAALGGVHHTAHFTISYPAELSLKKVERLAQDHELRHAQLSAFFGRSPGHIHSYIFADAQQKRRLMGAGRTFVAKPWRQEVYLQQESFPHRVLKHELAHVFARPAGDRLLGVSLRWHLTPLPHPVFNVGLIEGLAVAADWRPYGELDGHQLAAALQRLGLAPPLAPLFGYGFLTQAASRSYTLAGSFCRYLADRYGTAKLLAAYRAGGGFDDIYGRPLQALLADWQRFLETVELPPEQLELARERFRQPSILRRTCAHEVANLKAKLYELRARERYDQALQLGQRLCQLEPDDPELVLTQLHTLFQAGRFEAAAAGGKRLLQHPALSQPLRHEVLELLGDLAWRQKDRQGAVAAYGKAATLDAWPAERRVLALKRWGLAQPAEVRALVARYLLPDLDGPLDGALAVHLAYQLADATAGAEDTGGLGAYLVAKQLALHDHPEAAVAPLERALALGLLGEDFRQEALRLLGESRYLAGQLGEAAAAFDALAAAPQVSGGSRLLAADWLDRIRWRQQARPQAPATAPAPRPGNMPQPGK